MSICVLAEADAELNELRNNFKNKFGDFAKLMGDNCSVFNTVSNLLDEAEDIVEKWNKELKDAVGEVIKAASKLYDIIADEIGAVLDEAIDKLKEMLNGANSVMDGIKAAVKEMMTAVKNAVDAVKQALCDGANDLVKNIPAEVIAGSAVLATLAAYPFAKDLDGKKIVGLSDVKAIADKALKATGIEDMKRSIEDMSKGFKPDIDLSAYKCIMP